MTREFAPFSLEHTTCIPHPQLEATQVSFILVRYNLLYPHSQNIRTYVNLILFSLTTGLGDKTICFNCRVGFQDWMSADNVWEEHATWSSYFVYVTFIK